ncbi:hypothetical protein MSAN_00428100 [Mycena sanguinolenta]|uniref:Uncharacterized protein n=1 Tax=Mycena sanguinolenta TaxID=230812 RepID=A0A8H6ZAC4_9AGAR|nr:hypothetical protein MSAN_00428100 [Mycena sanguinolenta]
MATFRTISITADKRPTRRISLTSLSSLASMASSVDSRIDIPIVVTTTISTTTRTHPATVPPPFTTSRGSDDILPRPQRGAPPVAPALSPEERKQKQRGVKHSLRRAIGLRAPLDPALCEGWW